MNETDKLIGRLYLYIFQLEQALAHMQAEVASGEPESPSDDAPATQADD